MAEVIARGSICGKCMPARYLLAILASLAFAQLYALRVNMSTAMIGMVNHTAIKNQTDDLDNSNIEDGPFIWSESLQGTILSSYFWGYVVSQIPGGRLAEVFSAKWVLFTSVFVNIVGTLLTPISANIHYSITIILRVLEGLGGGVSFPAMHAMLAKWAPPFERSIMSSVVYAGTCLGTAASILSTGVIATKISWEAVFYIQGGVCSIWCFLWAWLITDKPDQQKYISIEERNFISQSLGTSDQPTTKRNTKVPWKKMFTSTPVCALFITHFCNNFGWYMILIELPFYMKQVLHFNLTDNAILNSIPYLTLWLFSIILSKIIDNLQSSYIISTTTARKTGIFLASVVPGSILVIVCYTSHIRWLTVLLMIIAVTFKAGMFSGHVPNHIDLASNFAGTLIGLTNSTANIAGIIVPLYVGYMTEGNQTLEAWRIIFYVTFGIYIIEFTVFAIFGSGEEQSWNRINNEE